MEKKQILHLNANDFEKKLILENENFEHLFLDVNCEQETAKSLENLDKSRLENLKNVEFLTVFIHHKINKNILKVLPNLKLICTRSTGTDHIDIENLKKLGVEVKNVVGYGAGSVAEHVFALILNISHNVNELKKRACTGVIQYEDLLGFDLENKTLGVVGSCGAIGRKVVQIASGFGMKILANDQHPDLKMEQDFNLKFVKLPELLEKSDIISLHIPLIDATRDLLNEENLQKVGKNKILINTSRGGIISNKTLLWSIENGIFKAVGVDALENEDLFENIRNGEKTKPQLFDENKEKIETLVKIINNEKILFTPHCAYYTDGSLKKIIDQTLQNIENFSA